LWPDSLDARQLAILLEADRARGDATRARELAGTTQERGPVLHGAGVWGLVALICLENGLLDDALRASDLAIAEQPDNAAYWQNRAVVLERLGSAAEAQRDRARALELDPSLADTSR
jgi:tetratricopeptide (TPR) repeat protein